MDDKLRLLSLKGCCSRLQWWQVNVALWYFYILLFAFNSLIFSWLYPPANAENGWIELKSQESISELFLAFTQGKILESFGVIILIGLLIITLWMQIAISVKRLHDINRSGSLWFVNLIPFIGSLIVFVLNAFFKSKLEDNSYCNNKEKNGIQSVSLLIAALMLSFVAIYDTKMMAEFNIMLFSTGLYWSLLFMVELFLVMLIIDFTPMLKLSQKLQLKLIFFFSLVVLLNLFYNTSDFFINIEGEFDISSYKIMLINTVVRTVSTAYIVYFSFKKLKEQSVSL